jgi:membrane-bound acyltransferase YfiQ involved in biofilm formation
MHWNIGESACMAGFFLIGYTLRVTVKTKKGGWLYIVLGLAAEIAAGVVLYRLLASGMDRTLAEHRAIMSYTPAIVLASVLIFAGTARLETKLRFDRLSACTYEIYLVHAFVLDMILRVSRHFFGQRWLTHLDARFAVPVLAVFVYLLSYGIGTGLKKAMN